MKNRNTIIENIDACATCAACHPGCPTYELTGSETLAARGKIRLAKAIEQGEIELTDRIVHDFETCLSCMSCAQNCPAGVDTMAVFNEIRTRIFEQRAGKITRFIHRHILPYPNRLNLMAKIVGLSTLIYDYAPEWLVRFFPYTPAGKRRVTPSLLGRNLRSTLPRITPAASGTTPIKRVAYFTGCLTDLAYQKTGRQVAAQLAQAGVEVVFPKEQICCGAPAYFTGDKETAQTLARKNIDLFAKLDVDAIVYSCATCGSVLTHVWPELFPDEQAPKDIAAKTIDFQKFLAQTGLQAISHSRKTEEPPIKVTYHDPCHLKRGAGVSDEPRTLLKSLPGIEFIEMENADACCGGAGTFVLSNYDMAMEQGRRKVEWIERSGADILVTACPSCQLQLADALSRYGSRPIPVLHTADLIAQIADNSR